MFVSGRTTQWLDYVPARALLVTASPSFCAVAMADGALNIYSHTGRRIMPTLALGAPAAAMDANKHALMVITTNGMLYSWCVSYSV